MDPLLLTAPSRIYSNTLSVTMTSTLLSSLMVSGLRSSLFTLEVVFLLPALYMWPNQIGGDPNKSIPSFFL